MPVSRKGCPNKLIRETERTIKAYGMFQPGDSVLVGVSGGPDSVALLYVLNMLASRLSLGLGVAHLNHCLRKKASDQDAAFVESLAKKLDLPCYIQKTDIRAYQHRHKLSLEEAARQVRYTFYKSVAGAHRFGKVALGHHSDDNAELVLMYLFRGSGALGLGGIPPVRDAAIVRPFIEVGRSEIMEFLDQNGLEYVCDRSNQDVRFLRNRVRQELIPLLKKEYNPKIVDSLNRVSAILRSEDEWLEALVAPLYDQVIAAAQEHKITLSALKLGRLPSAAVRRIVRRAIAAIKGDLRRISFRHIHAIRQLTASGPEMKRLDLPDRICVRREGEHLVFSKEAMPLRQLGGSSGAAQSISRAPDYSYEVREPGILLIREIDCCLTFEAVDKKRLKNFRQAGHSTAFLDMDRLHFPLKVRNYRSGDCFTPLGMTGTQKINKYFIDNKVPRAERRRCPLLLSAGKIIWVAGHRIAESVKILPTTQSALKVEQVLA
ncbi:MAG: tRNA lysidine(34) synthetase TilS [Desulfobacterales bacterium]|nr:tRNA lysidine(34) synthetase TilS [Desulfobacterales bacterium]